jgi:signal transduction histidine kinase
VGVIGTSRIRRSALWLLLAVSLAAPIVFIWVRDHTPADGARVSWYEDAWTAEGVLIDPIDAPAAGLEDGDLVLAVDDRSIEGWLAVVADPSVARPHPSLTMPYEVRRDGTLMTVDVDWAIPSIGSTLVEGWGFVVFSIVFGAVGAFVFARKPDEPAAIPLLFIAAAAAGSSVPWFLGTSVSDIVQGPQFLLFALLTGPLYMLLWPASLHLAFVFPYRLPAVDRRPWLVPAAYLAGFGSYLALLVGGWLLSPTLSEWLGTWPLAQLAVVVPLLTVTLAIFVRSYRRTTDEVAKNRMRWAAFGAVASGAATLVLFWLPELLLGRPILGSSWLGIVALFFPFGLAFGILRYHLFDIDVVINRTLVYGGLTLGILASYAVVAAALGALVGTEHGIGLELLATGAAALVALPLRDALQRTVNRLMYGERDEPWRAMHRLSEVLEWAAEPDRAFPAVVDTVRDALRLPYVALALIDADGTERIVAERGDLRGATMDVPLVHGREPVGRLVLGVRSGESGFRSDEQRLLEDLARQAGTAINAIRLRDDLARSRERLVVAREEERRRLRRDLHDGLGPSLAGIGLRAEASAATLVSDPAGARKLLDELGGDVRVALTDVRRLVDGLRPPALDELGLVEAVRQQAARLEAGGAAGIPTITVEADPLPLPELTAAVEVAAYRIAVEGLTNAVRHASATTCSVLLDATEPGTLRVEVVDDGRGLPADIVPGVGLDSMRDRAEEVGGSLVIEVNSEGGTRVVARLPLAGAQRRVHLSALESADSDPAALPNAPEAHSA